MYFGHEMEDMIKEQQRCWLLLAASFPLPRLHTRPLGFYEASCYVGSRRTPTLPFCKCMYVYLVRGMYAFKYSLTVAPAPRQGWNKFRPLQAPGANFQCNFSFLKTYEITSHSPDGLAPPTAPLKGLAAAFLRMPRFKLLTRTRFKSSSQSPERTISTQSPDENIPPKAPMKNYTQKRKKKQQKKCFSRFWKGPRCFPSFGWRARSRHLLENPKRLDGGMKQSWILLLLHQH